MKRLQERSADDFLQSLANFECWFQSPLGRALLSSQRAQIEVLTKRIFGYHQLEIGVNHRVPIGGCTSLGHKMLATPLMSEHMPESTMICQPDEIPLIHDIVDLAILHHTLDFTTSPHQTLREVSRVVKGGGHIIIVGFNPVSLWGIRRLLSKRKQAPWNGRFISGKRVEDWLGLLDFKVEHQSYHFFAPPIQNPSILNKFGLVQFPGLKKVPVGAYYTVLARKQVGCMIPLKDRWRKAKVVGMPVANRIKPE